MVEITIRIDDRDGQQQWSVTINLRNSCAIRVGSGRVDESFGVQVSDSGAGIDPEFLPRAFSAFEQGDLAHNRKPGLGLGLAICKAIMDLHGGTVTAQSERKGHGATFVVKLPVAVGLEAVSSQSETDVSNARRPTRQLRILLVEDHADTARIMRRLLAMDGHDVQWGADVASALKLAAANEFDLLLSDVGLPDGTRVDLMRMLRQQGSNPPGIVLSGYGQDEDVARSREAGFAGHLVKPLTLPVLREAIAAQIG